MAEAAGAVEVQAPPPLEMAISLFVSPQHFLEACELYVEGFGFKVDRSTYFYSTEHNDTLIGCYELKKGSTTLLLSVQGNLDAAAAAAADANFQSNFCTRLEVSNIYTAIAEAEKRGCRLIRGVEDDPLLPMVQVAMVIDPFNHRWQFANSENGLGKRGLMNQVNINVLYMDPDAAKCELVRGLCQSFDGTPQVECHTHLSIQEVFQQHQWLSDFLLCWVDPSIAPEDEQSLLSQLKEGGFQGSIIHVNPETLSFKDISSMVVGQLETKARDEIRERINRTAKIRKWSPTNKNEKSRKRRRFSEKPPRRWGPKAEE